MRSATAFLRRHAEGGGSAVLQVGSRIWVLWGIINLAPRPTTSGSVELLRFGQHAVQLNFVTLVVAWSLTEVVRYSFYAVKVRFNLLTMPVCAPAR